ncbi:MAG TPA: urate hydroxylase PuuD [Oligoflexus sp.]|uniref:urate hydroxylase PuuD n=1 Tax=Oligoflexus sp. TaxID=1971216 RepID=UPI002D61A6E0|nr:urate hydroxylase PuuD [Oligoflexus sp.]HYX34803.1 urate hydroxylase PuuD [Oligoflexus sp.]
MESYLMDWALMLLRWVHVITVIAWIGASFYFVWLDNSLEKPQAPDLLQKGVDGELWAVHGGGFYNPQKYLVAPPSLPPNLHWFYWESYSTWLSGFALFIALYLMNARTYMIDPQIFAMSESTAVLISLGFLVAGWLVYEGICRFLGRRPWFVAGALALLIALASYLATQIFQGRAAFLIVGAMLATIMTANVFFWIIPGQRRVTAAMRAGEKVDPIYGQRGKQRSVHNTYLTLPVLFAMLSNHYSLMYNHPMNWLVLVLMMVASVLIRQFFLLKHKKKINWYFPLSGVAIMVGVLFWIAPVPKPVQAQDAAVPDTQRIMEIVQARCTGCHATQPVLMGGPAPKGVILENSADVERHAISIFIQTVQTKIMPLGNITHMTEDERAEISRWFASRSAAP